MSLLQLKPAKDASFFEQLAEVNESMLVTAAMTVAVRKDYASLNGLVDFLSKRGQDLDVLVNNTSMSVPVPWSATDTRMSGSKKQNDSIAHAFAIGMGAMIVGSTGWKYEKESPPEALALALRMQEVYPKERAAAQGTNPLDVLLHHAATHVTDPLIFQALFAAGGKADKKFECTLDGLNKSRSNTVLDLLPEVLSVVKDPQARNDEGKTPIDVLKTHMGKDASVPERWDSIVKSHALRGSAMSLIDQMEREQDQPIQGRAP